MQTRPDQPPEGKLIAAAAERMDLSIREASRRAGISYGRWRQIASGVQHVSPGEFAAVHAPARTLAKMARVVSITPEQMEAEGQRPDAAEIMRETVSIRPAPAREFGEEDLPDDDIPPQQMEAFQDYADEFKVKLARARRRHPGERLGGGQVFPRNPVHAMLWDILDGLGWPADAIPRSMAAMLVMREEAGSGSAPGSAAGLTAPAIRVLR